MLSLVNISVEKNGKKIISGLNITVKQGEIVEVYGRNGSGKTTLLKVLALIQKPSAGKIIFDNRDISLLKDHILSKIRLHDIGYVEQQYRLIPGTMVIESVSLPLILMGINKKDAQERALRLIKRIGLEGKAYEVVENLSGGERQRVSLASSFIKDPKVLILDEPFSSQDEVGEEIIREMIKEFKSIGKAIVFSSPYLIEGIADKIYLMKDGKLIQHI